MVVTVPGVEVAALIRKRRRRESVSEDRKVRKKWSDETHYPVAQN